MPPLDRVVDVARDPHSVQRLGSREPLQVDVIDDERDLDLAGKIGQKEGDPLEHPDQDERLPFVVA